MTESISKSDSLADWRLSKTWYTHETIQAKIAKLVVRAYYYPQLKIERRGFENLPAGGCILVANHISADDPPLLGISLPRHPFMMAKKELFARFEWGLRVLGTFPINRGALDSWAFEQVGNILAAGQVVTMFAEGSRQRGEKVALRRAKTGAVRMALRYKVPVVPCAILGPEQLRRRRFKGWRPVTVKISIGKPIDVVDLAAEPYSRQIYRDITTYVMQQVALLLPAENRGVYA